MIPLKPRRCFVEKIWQKLYVKRVPKAIDFDQISLPEALTRTASRFPDRPALIFQGTTVTYREVEDMVSRFAAALVAMGAKPGGRVSLVMPNLIQTVVAIYGALRAGATVVTHNPRNDDMQLEFQINNAGSDTVVCLDILVPRMINIRKRTGVKKIISCHIRDYLPFLAKKLFPLVKKELHLKTPEESDVFEFTELLETSRPHFRASHTRMDDTAFILYTSATTGKAKGVEITHANASVNVQQLHSWFPGFVDGQESVVACLPFFHVFGLTCSLNTGIFYGYAVILVPLPDPKSILEAIDTYKATYIPALPTFYTGMINDPNLKKYDLKSLKGCFSGASPLPLETIRTFEKLTGAQICEGYGLTECSPVSHINPFGGKTKPGTIGLPLPSTDAKIVDVDDHTIEITTPGEPGELCIKGPQVMKGYVNLADETEATIKDGWLLTGDIVTVDEEGFFTVVNRKKELILCGGERIYPRELDEVLYSHPKVLDACAIGVPDASQGQSIKAFVVLKKGEQASAQEIIDFCSQNLAPHKVPQHVAFISDLPRTPVGKVLRRELKRIHLVQTSSLNLKRTS
jgi:long-chain acyl-CoA synthetase